MQTRTPNPPILIGPKKKKKPVLIGQKEPILFFQLKCKWGYNCTTLIGQGKSQAFGWNKMLETLIRVAQTAGTVQEAASSLQLFPEAQREWEPLFSNDYKILFINFNPVSHQEFFFFFNRHIHSLGRQMEKCLCQISHFPEKSWSNYWPTI